MIQGNIFNIQRYTIHDGPGIRTELFLKGCPLSCKWCGNPESWALEVEPGVYTSKCIGKETCGLCRDACPYGEKLDFTEDVLTAIDRSLCIGCMACAKVCPADAIRQWGQVMSVEEAMEVVLRDRHYYESSGGGVTVSGGEPLLQADFVAELFRRCKAEGIHTCLESTFCVDWGIVEKVLPHTDLLISDIKHMDPEIHQRGTGVSNEKILENLRSLSRTSAQATGLAKPAKPVILRIPVIPGFNDDMENMEKTADFILEEMSVCQKMGGADAKEGPVQMLQLLSFMRLGEEKYKSLGMSYEMEGVEVDREAFQRQMDGFADYFNGRGIPCIVGTKEKEAERNAT